jgi:hypothetical protein
MKAFSISDYTLVNTTYAQGSSQTEVASSLLTKLSSLQIELSKDVIVVDMIIHHNSSANYWEGTVIYTTIDSGITFH